MDDVTTVELVADYVPAFAQVGATVVPIGIPVILADGFIVWQGTPVPPHEVQAARRQLIDLAVEMRKYWPEVWARVDWWDETTTLWTPDPKAIINAK